MDQNSFRHLLNVQDGVVSRAQVLGCGAEPHDIRRLVRRRDLTVIIPGVYVGHTGEPTWQQRAVAGVLHAGNVDDKLHMRGAALGGHSALHAALDRAWSRFDERAPIEIGIDDRRTVLPVRGYHFVRVRGLADRTDWLRTPPRIFAAEAGLDVALRVADPLEAVGLLADLCQSRHTSAAAILEALGRRRRIRARGQWVALLRDLSDGTGSVLEHEFLVRVIRAHGLPEPDRQTVRTVASGHEYRDCEWPARNLAIELDGRLFHDNAAQRNADLERDLDDALTGILTVRLGWAQASTHACRTATKVASLLRQRGWTGSLKRCPSCSSA